MYSQFGEDELIAEILGETKPGRLLDIGAWHPITFSNSRLLIERGWGGVLVEPSPGPLKALLAEYGHRPEITIIAAAVGLAAGLDNFRITDDAVTTSDAGVAKTWAAEGGYLGYMLVPVITLPQISNQFGGFEFVNIDAEGSSVDLATAYLRGGGQARCVCVEHDGRLVELLSIASEFRYSAAHTNGTNVVLRRG